jgi:hypothetical protein
MLLILMTTLFACAPAVGPAQKPADDTGEPVAAAVGEIQVGAPPGCAAPVDGFARLTDESEARGLVGVVAEPADGWGLEVDGRGGAPVAQDLDGDGDIDLLIQQPGRGPDLYENDGTGQFTLRGEAFPLPLPEAGPADLAIGATDLDGDGYPEVILAGVGGATVVPNRGGLSFGSPVPVPVDDGSDVAFVAFSLGDVDGDGDLDLALAASGRMVEGVLDKTDTTVLMERLLLQEADGSWRPGLPLLRDGRGYSVQVVLLTDRDADGDADLLVPADLGAPSAFWRNDGLVDGQPWFVDDAEDRGAALVMAGMGVDAAYLNDDEVLDYCITDLGPIRCLLSHSGGWADGGRALGLAPDEWVDPDFGTTGWALELVDIDNSGTLDAVQASAPELARIGATPSGLPDLMWEGQEDGLFVDRSVEAGFDDWSDHYGLVAADFAADGYVDLVLTGPGLAPKFLSNPCGEASWSSVDLLGPPGNREGIGATVQWEAGGHVWRRTVLAARGPAQGPSQVTVGTHDSLEFDVVEVTWPDGAVSRAEGVASSRPLMAVHPDAAGQ